MAKQQLTAHDGDAARGLSAFVNVTIHDKKTNEKSDMQNIGLVYEGLMDARPQDEIAIGVARIHMNDHLQMDQHQEIDSEIYYGFHANNWLTIRPNVQYIHHVGADKDGENVWAGGVKFHTSF